MWLCRWIQCSNWKRYVRVVDKFRYIFGDIKSLFRKQQLFVNINNQKWPILGRVGTYHVTIDITGKDVNINDEVIFSTSIKHVDSSVRREWK